MVNFLVDSSADKLIGIVTQHPGGRRIDKGHFPIKIYAKNTLADGFQK